MTQTQDPVLLLASYCPYECDKDGDHSIGKADTALQSQQDPPWIRMSSVYDKPPDLEAHGAYPFPGQVSVIVDQVQRGQKYLQPETHHQIATNLLVRINELAYELNPTLMKEYPWDNDINSGSRFDRLATYVREKIWRLTIKERIITYDRRERAPRSQYSRVTMHNSAEGRFGRSIKLQPAILSICRESRRVAAKLGVASFYEIANLWWFPATDVIYFNGYDRFHDFVAWTSPEAKRVIRNVAVLGHDRCSWRITDWNWFRPLVKALPRLQTLHVFAPGQSLELIQTRTGAPFREPFWSLEWPAMLKALPLNERLGKTSLSSPITPWIQLTDWGEICEEIQRNTAGAGSLPLRVFGWEYNRFRPKARARKRKCKIDETCQSSSVRELSELPEVEQTEWMKPVMDPDLEEDEDGYGELDEDR